MNLKIVLLTRSSRPSGAQMAWRLLQAGYPLTVLVENRSRAIIGTGKKTRLLLHLFKLGPLFLWGRVAESIKIKTHFFLRKLLKKRFKDPMYWSIEELALAYPVKMHWVEDHNGPDSEKLLKEICPDLGVLTNTRRIRSHILSISRLGFLNLHMSALPQYAGLDSIFWALYHGEKQIGVTIHKVVPEIDRGDILLQKKFPVHSLDTEESLYARALWLGTALMARAVKLMEESKASPVAQNSENASYFSWPSQKQRSELHARRLKEKQASGTGPVRVLHIITRMTRGGAQENTLATALYLKNKNYDVTLITGPSWSQEGELLTEAMEQGLNVLILPDLVREIRHLSDIKALRTLYRLLKENPFSIVHTHTSKAGLLGRQAAFLAGIPLIIHTPHGHIFHSYFSPPGEKLFLLLERMAAKWCHGLIALTESEKREHLELRVGKPDMWHVIPSGVNEKKFVEISEERAVSFKQSLGIPKDAKLVGFVGRLTLIKGPRYFVEAMPLICREIPQAHFLIVGDGEDRSFLEQKIQSLGMAERVTMTGQKEEVSEHFGILDVLVVPSLNEGMGRVIAEAGLLAKPVIGSNVGGIPDLIEHHETGWLVTPRNKAEIAHSVIRLLNDTETSRRLGRALKQKVLAGFTEDSMVSQIEDLYREMSAPGRHQP